MTNRIIAGALIILSAIAQPALAKTIYTSRVSNGNWGTSSSWIKTGTGSPVEYNIPFGSIITVNIDVESAIDTINISGTLVFQNKRKIKMVHSGLVNLNFDGIIQGGNNESGFEWKSSDIVITGPFNGANEINGAKYATKATSQAAAPVSRNSFVNSLIALPVDLKSISVMSTNNEHNLIWTVTDEELNTTYIVEISENGRDYSTVGIRSILNETGDASFAVNLGKRSRSFYTRLSRQDKNGFQKILSIHYTKVNVGLAKLQLFPTVLENNEVLKIIVEDAGDYVLDIYNMSGTRVAFKSFQAESAAEVKEIVMTDWNLVSGYYIAIISGSNNNGLKTKILINR